jgi:nitrous oxidase accessory protein NosD
LNGVFNSLWVRWLDLLVRQSNDPVVNSLQLGSYTVATLPSAAVAGMVIYVSDESGGAVLAFSDGINWRRCTDRAIVS